MLAMQILTGSACARFHNAFAGGKVIPCYKRSLLQSATWTEPDSDAILATANAREPARSLLYGVSTQPYLQRAPSFYNWLHHPLMKGQHNDMTPHALRLRICRTRRFLRKAEASGLYQPAPRTASFSPSGSIGSGRQMHFLLQPFPGNVIGNDCVKKNV